VRRLLAKRGTGSNEANQLYLMGRHHWNKRSWEGFEKGIECFRQAIEKDPGYALAYAGLADCYSGLVIYEKIPPDDGVRRAREASLRALELDPYLAEAHTSRAYVALYWDWDWLVAEKEFQRAIELNPRNATAHHWYGEYLTFMGRFDEAAREKQRAVELEPASPVIRWGAGFLFYYTLRFDKAAESFREAITLDPTFGFAHEYLGWSLVGLRAYEDAIKEFQEAFRLKPEHTSAIAGRCIAYAEAGRRNDALKALAELKELEEQRYVSPGSFVWAYIGLSDHDKALEYLEKCYMNRADFMVGLRSRQALSIFESLRSDPRFQALLRKMNFPEK